MSLWFTTSRWIGVCTAADKVQIHTAAGMGRFSLSDTSDQCDSTLRNSQSSTARRVWRRSFSAVADVNRGDPVRHQTPKRQLGSSCHLVSSVRPESCDGRKARPAPASLPAVLWCSPDFLTCRIAASKLQEKDRAYLLAVLGRLDSSP